MAPAGSCAADTHHCCLSDGRIVVPGGCQPDYPDNVEPATERGPDGYCKRIPCYLRCLPATARIATPLGDVAVAELAPGHLVWSLDAAGERVAVPVVDLVSLPAPASHTMVELTLADGRVVRASAGHPTPLGGSVGALRRGDALDGAPIVGVRVVPYAMGRTWDLLPAGDTGLYWADGVLLGSTLAGDGR